MTDQNRKTLRSFYCRDYLWEHFEQMAQELGCSMDYLINESMRLYARNRDYSGSQDQFDGGFGGSAPGGGGGFGGPQQGQQEVDRFDVGGQGMNHRTFERVPAVGGGPATQRQPPQRPSRPQPPGFGAQSAGGPPPPPPRPGPAPGPPQGGNDWHGSGPPKPPGSFGAEPAFGQPQSSGRQPLYLSFNNNRYTIEKDKFVIGRGSENTDLTIRDGNISRKHCAVIFRNGAYYIKDLGSTNGVEYRGNRIESKKIEEGDVFFLCDYELRFSYR